MALSEQDRQRTVSQYMRDVRENFGITKADLRSALNGLDDFFDANATAINNAIPQPARGALSTTQKAILVGYVAFRRAGKLVTEEDRNG